MAMDLSDYLQVYARKKHIKKTDVAYRSGITLNYLYKIFGGLKRTKQRDYIIAICRAMGMDVPEAPVAWTLNEMKVLRPNDPRDWIIMKGFSRGQSVHTLNMNLEDQGFNELKVRCDI